MRDGSGGNRIYVCPFANRCGCRVRYRLLKSDSVMRLQCDGKHDSESHSVDNTRQGLRLEQRASVERVARAHPTSSATQVRRNLSIQELPVYVSPSKHRHVQRVVKQVRDTVFEKFTMGERVENSEGSLTRLSTNIFFKTMVEEHNRGGKHLTLHDPICLGFQYSKNVIYGCYSTVFMTCNIGRAIASGWGLGMGFDSTGPISNSKFDTIGITTNLLGRRANPVCLAFVSQECAVAYTCTYDAVEAGLYEILVNTKICKRDKGCEVCDSIRELREEQEVDAVLHPRKAKVKAKAPPGAAVAPADAPAADADPSPDPPATAAPAPRSDAVFSLPLEKPICDNTTKFSKFIIKRLPHLLNKIGQCATHLRSCIASIFGIRVKQCISSFTSC